MEKTIRVYRGGRHIKDVERPVHVVGKHKEVTYKGQRYRVLVGDRIEVDPAPELEPVPSSKGISTPVGHEEDTPVHRRSDLPGSDEWTDQQRKVVEAPQSARLIVEAAPGTGKTAVACARVAHLLCDHLPANSIWLISFTRTAIHEIRQRITRLAGDVQDVHGVKIATIDSQAWQLRQGFDGPNKDVFSTFERGIEDAIEMLEDPGDDLRAELESIEHLVIDEAQDVVGNRRELLLQLIRLLRRDAGVTVLCDPAQAIYGFTEDDEPTVGDLPLPEMLKQDSDAGFTVKPLEEVIRTASPGLRHIFVQTRKLVLHQSQDSFARVLSDLGEHCDGKVAMEVEQNGIADRDDVLVLYRKRSEVLTSGAFLANKQRAFRVRMSGYPTHLAPWIAVVFHDWLEPTMPQQEFERRFGKRLPARWKLPEVAEAWAVLVRHAGRSATSVDVKRLREVLCRSQPPLELASAELGERGPILGTIHASKGREADEVHLMLADLKGESELDADELRVVFVGATRARNTLKLGRSGGRYCSNIKSGRCYHASKDARKAQVEVGRRDDLDEASIVSRSLFPTEAAALENMQRLYALGGEPVRGVMRRVNAGGSEWEWRLLLDANGPAIGRMNQRFNDDLWEVVKATAKKRKNLKMQPPMSMNNIFLLGCRTIVRAPGDPALPLQHEPWASSGFWLAPVVFAYSMAGFRHG